MQRDILSEPSSKTKEKQWNKTKKTRSWSRFNVLAIPSFRRCHSVFIPGVFIKQGRIQDLFRRGAPLRNGVTNTNKPYIFLHYTSCIRSEGWGAHPLHPPPRSAPVKWMWRESIRHVNYHYKIDTNHASRNHIKHHSSYDFLCLMKQMSEDLFWKTNTFPKKITCRPIKQLMKQVLQNWLSSWKNILC